MNRNRFSLYFYWSLIIIMADEGLGGNLPIAISRNKTSIFNLGIVTTIYCKFYGIDLFGFVLLFHKPT